MTQGHGTLALKDEAAVLQLTPIEWRRLLEDRSFLDDDSNRFQPPRRYRGRLVEIVPASPRNA